MMKSNIYIFTFQSMVHIPTLFHVLILFHCPLPPLPSTYFCLCLGFKSVQVIKVIIDKWNKCGQINSYSFVNSSQPFQSVLPGCAISRYFEGGFLIYLPVEETIMAKTCKVPNCNKESGCTLFRLPSDKIARQRWLKIIRDAYPNLSFGKGKTIYLCQKHFKKSDVIAFRDLTDATGRILQRELLRRRYLKAGAVPHFKGFVDLPHEDSLKVFEIVSNEPGPSTDAAENLHQKTNLRVKASKFYSSKKNSKANDDADRWTQCDSCIDKTFEQNNFGIAGDVCDRLWFTEDFKMENTEAPTELEFVNVDIKCEPVTELEFVNVDIKCEPVYNISDPLIHEDNVNEIPVKKEEIFTELQIKQEYEEETIDFRTNPEIIP